MFLGSLAYLGAGLGDRERSGCFVVKCFVWSNLMQRYLHIIAYRLLSLFSSYSYITFHTNVINMFVFRDYLFGCGGCNIYIVSSCTESRIENV